MTAHNEGQSTTYEVREESLPLNIFASHRLQVIDEARRATTACMLVCYQLLHMVKHSDIRRSRTTRLLEESNVVVVSCT